MKIPIAKPILGEEELNEVDLVLLSGDIAYGPMVKKFEENFSEYCECDHGIATSNGTTALHTALLAVGIKPGDEVIVPTFSFIATATAVSMIGAKPVFVDVEEDTFQIDPLKVVDAITPQTKAIIGVHLFGQPFDAQALLDICDIYNLILIEDAAQAHGAKYHEKRVGSIGRIATFSFYATKNMTTGEGGMITTNSKIFAERCRATINHGQKSKYVHTTLGYNYRMTDIAASIGLVQLKRLDEFNSKRRAIANYYNAYIKNDNIILPKSYPDVQHVYHQYALVLKDSFPMKREEFISYLESNGIGSAVHYPIPIHQQPLYKTSHLHDKCPVSTKLSKSIISIPVHPALKIEEIEHICNIINGVQ